jgi:hypothetical protein
MKTGLKIILLALALTALVSRAQAQTYSIDWYTIDGGGGTSTGGTYQVSGTIGQPDAGGPMTNGQYAVTGGFWALAAVQTPGVPRLWVSRTTTNTVVVWWALPDTGWQLRSATSLVAGSTWTDISPPYQTNASNLYYVEPVPSGNKFYRLKK